MNGSWEMGECDRCGRESEVTELRSNEFKYKIVCIVCLSWLAENGEEASIHGGQL